MNQDIKASTLIIVVLIFGSLLYAKFWASSEAKSINVYSYIHQHPEGGSYIKLNNKLMGFNPKSELIATIDLAKFNVQENNSSDFAFFSNGDLLLRKKAQQKNFIENLQRYFRFTNPTNKISPDDQEGLFRCNLLSYTCTSFTQQALNINGAFSLAIDIKTDRVFIADSSRHQVYMYSSDGLELDTAKNFKFPNQIEVANNQLYVADTNHHRLASFDISKNEIGEIKQSFDTRTTASRKLMETWPSAFLLIENQRWIINSKNGMSYGGIYIFDNLGGFLKKLKLPAEADPFALIQLGDQVLISDFSLDRIYRFSLEGEQLADFKSLELQKIQKQLTEKSVYYQWLNDMFSILFAVSLATGFLLALYQQNQVKKAVLAEPDLTNQALQNLIEEPVLHWIKLSTRAKVFNIVLLTFCVICYLLVSLIPWLSGMSLYEFFVVTWRLQVILIILTVSLLLQFRRKIAITQNLVMIYPLLGSKVVCLKNEIISNDVHILVGKSIFQIPHLYKLYAANDIESFLYPAIKQGKQVDRIEMQAILAGNKYVRITQFILIVFLLGAFLYYGVL